MNIKGFLMWAKDYKLTWQQVCNLAFCLGANHDQLIEAVLEMRSPCLTWMELLYDDNFITKAQYDQFWARKRA